jgi:hypothetical protein
MRIPPGEVAEVGGHLPSKCETLSSNPSATKKKILPSWGNGREGDD